MKMSVAVTPSCAAFHAPAASEAHAASKGYSCKTARDRGSPTDAGRCGTALSHLLARCCMRPNTDFFARNVSSRCGLKPPATSAARVAPSMGKSCSMRRSLGSFDASSTPRDLERAAAEGDPLPCRAAFRPAAVVPFLPAGELDLHPFLLPFGRPRLVVLVGADGTTPMTFPAPSPRTAGMSPSALSFASFFPSEKTDLSSSFLNFQANMFRSWSRLHNSWNEPPGARRVFMSCHESIAVDTSSASLGSICTPRGANTELMRFTSVL